jgi:predicted acetyltransferase
MTCDTVKERLDDPPRLVRPACRNKQAFLEMLSAYRALGSEKYSKEYGDPVFAFDFYVAMLEKYSQGDSLPEFWVPTTTFWLINGSGAILGTGRLRHRLNERLMLEGGHIGYDIHPFYRSRGYGTQILRQLLAEAGKKGITRMLLTCDSDNSASRRIIEKNGGVLENEITLKESGKKVLRFWITNTIF